MSHALLRGTATKYNMGGAIVICGPLDAGRFRQGLECALGAHDVQRVLLHPDAETAMQEFLPEDECSYPFEMLDFANRPEPLQSAADWYSQTSASPYAWTSFRFTAKYCSGHSLIAATVAETYNELLRCRRLPRLRAAFVTPASFGTTARMPYPGRSNGERSSPAPAKLASFVQNG